MTNINTYLSNIRERVDQELDRLLPRADDSPKRLHEAMRYSVFAGGRRFRPALCIASCEAVGGTFEQVLLAACAIEVLHTYTLIHDDLPAMDDDDMRRGKPSSHKAFDEGTAILAGDALLTIAFEWLGKTGNARLVQELAQATGSLGTIGGQADDLDAKNTSISQEAVLSIHERKTAALFRASCRMGGITADASGKQIDMLGQFGEHLGIAFQLLDDICDTDPITMNAYSKDEVILLVKKYEQLSYDALKKIKGDTSQMQALARHTYASFNI
ncbi:MAG TPA: polyprenyl synthetase family protein [Candidatus Andersenbacteria bacterium]|nr:polyprenyl synthetase family protein [Candidatus Andersenbacteria bacterium]